LGKNLAVGTGSEDLFFLSNFHFLAKKENKNYRLGVVVGVFAFLEPELDQLNGVVHVTAEDLFTRCMVGIDGEAGDMGFWSCQRGTRPPGAGTGARSTHR
jgi:hypothetical protein